MMCPAPTRALLAAGEAAEENALDSHQFTKLVIAHQNLTGCDARELRSKPGTLDLFADLEVTGEGRQGTGEEHACRAFALVHPSRDLAMGKAGALSALLGVAMMITAGFVSSAGSRKQPPS